MKFVKGISLFLIYPVLCLSLGFYAGVKAVRFFYPGLAVEQQESRQIVDGTGESPLVEVDTGRANESGYGVGIERVEVDEGVDSGNGLHSDDGLQQSQGTEGAGVTGSGEDAIYGETGEDLQAVSADSESLCVDTEYVLEEMDVLNQTVVETTWRLPAKYVGMNREQFLVAMENYEAFPPLAEMERGFVGLEVLSFSRERVVVQMNYQYLQPSQSFYLAVLNNEVVVYLEDKQTIYINTGILLEKLPEELQMDIMQMMYVEDEERLYYFLESYSS